MIADASQTARSALRRQPVAGTDFTQAGRSRRDGSSDVGRRRSFTLVELMLVTVIIAILSSTLLFALQGATEDAREKRTRSQINKINQLILERWDGFRTRKIPIRVPPNITPVASAFLRMSAIREVMRMEMPDRITDLTFSPTPIRVPTISGQTIGIAISPPSLWRTYRRRAGLGRGVPPAPWPSQSPTVSDLIATEAWTIPHQGAECLYLIVASIQDGDSSALEFFKDSEIGDTDGDSHPEILDAWGRPIEFLRWAPGFATLAGPDQLWGVANSDDDGSGGVDDAAEIGAWGSDDRSELQARPYFDLASNSWKNDAPDPFDPLRVDPRWFGTNVVDDPFALFPLIYSAGRDGVLDIATENPTSTFAYALQTPPNDPYAFLDPVNRLQAGRPIKGADSELNSEDNITNHLLEAE